MSRNITTPRDRRIWQDRRQGLSQEPSMKGIEGIDVIEKDQAEVRPPFARVEPRVVE